MQSLYVSAAVSAVAIVFYSIVIAHIIPVFHHIARVL